MKNNAECILEIQENLKRALKIFIESLNPEEKLSHEIEENYKFYLFPDGSKGCFGDGGQWHVINND